MGDRKIRLGVVKEVEQEETKAKANRRKPKVEKLKAQGMELRASRTASSLEGEVAILSDGRLSDLSNPTRAAVDPSAALQRAEAVSLPVVSPTDILSLQQIVGNRSTARLLESRSLQPANAQAVEKARGRSGDQKRGLLGRFGDKLKEWNDKFKEKHPILDAIGIGGLISAIGFIIGAIIAGITAATASGVLAVIGGILGIVVVVLGIVAGIWWIMKKIEEHAREKATKEREEAQEQEAKKLEEKTAKLEREQEKIRNLLKRHGIEPPKPPPKPAHPTLVSKIRIPPGRGG